jgi:hypothetical protein
VSRPPIPATRSGKVGHLAMSSAASPHVHRYERHGEVVHCFILTSNGQSDPMIISTLYLPETTVNVRYQCVLSRSVCAGQAHCSVATGTVR